MELASTCRRAHTGLAILLRSPGGTDGSNPLPSSEESHKPRSLRQFRPRLLWSDEVQRDLTPSYAPDILSDELDA